jgi:hypothetical protein
MWWTESWTDIWPVQRGQLTSAWIRGPPEHRRTAAEVSGAAASRSLEMVRSMAMADEVVEIDERR